MIRSGNEPFFSIIVPIYNMSGKMDGCYESISNQDYDNFEVLFIDDGDDNIAKGTFRLIYDSLVKNY